MKKVFGILSFVAMSFLQMVSAHADFTAVKAVQAQLQSLTPSLKIAPKVEFVDFCGGKFYVRFNMPVEPGSVRDAFKLFIVTSEGPIFIESLDSFNYAESPDQKHFEIAVTSLFQEEVKGTVLINTDIVGTNGIAMKGPFAQAFSGYMGSYGSQYESIADSTCKVSGHEERFR